MPQSISYNSDIPTPESVIGHEVGEWHVTHDKLVQYMEVLASKSNRIHIETRGYTFEDRPLLLLTITSPNNHQNLAQIQEQHLNLTNNPNSTLDLDGMPIVVYQGFSIHEMKPRVQTRP